MDGTLARKGASQAATAEKRRYRRRPVAILAEIQYSRGIRSLREAKALVRNISEGGIQLDTRGIADLPDSFYIRFPFSDERIVCYVLNRDRLLINATFAHPLPTTFVDRIAKLPSYQR